MIDETSVIQLLRINIERTRVTTFEVKGKKYAKVQKVVPIEWVGSDVVIMRKDDFDALIKFIGAVIEVMNESIINEAKARATLVPP